jgi:putative ABC transport system permease protein
VNAGTVMRARSDVRSRAASLIAVTLFIGFAGAVSMTAFTAAARAQTSYARFRASTNEPAVIMFGGPQCPFSHHLDLGAMAALPQVSSMQLGWTSFVNATDREGKPLMFADRVFDSNLVALDLHQPGSIRPHLVSGRYPQAIDEVTVSWGETDRRRPTPGETFDVSMLRSGSEEALNTGKLTPDDLITVPLTVVGTAIDVGGLDGTSGALFVTPAFADRYRDRVLNCDVGAFQLRNDLNDAAAFWTGAKRITPGAFGFDTSGERTLAARTTSLQSAILRLFGGLAALAALLVLGQVLVRRTLLASTDAPVLRALGMSRAQLVRAALLPAIAVALLAALLAVIGAIMLSVFTPFGQARILEPEPGLYVDPKVLVTGAAAIVVSVLACVAIPAWRASREAGSMLGTAEFGGVARPSRTAAAIASIGMPVSAVAGTRLALEPGHGRTATPVRSAIIGLTLTVIAMVAAFGFAASMDRFTSNPALWGIRFDFASGHPFIGDLFEERALPVVVDDPGVASVTAGNFQEEVGLKGPSGEQSVAIWGTQVMKGDEIDLTMLRGRWPRSEDEIALGAQTARDLGVDVGDTVEVQLAGTSRPLTVVGIPVFPDFGFGPGLGQGAGATMDLLRTLYPETTLNLFFARFAPGVDRQATLDRINARFEDINPDLEVRLDDTASLGTSLQHTRKSRGLPLILAGLFGVVALATLVHVLVTSVRRRRRDLAILRTIGFRRRQIAATIAWQATTIAVISLLIGVPVGFLVGRFTWALFADHLGVVSVPVAAWSSIAVVVPTVLILANVVAIGPALFARRTQPAQELRTE